MSIQHPSRFWLPRTARIDWDAFEMLPDDQDVPGLDVAAVNRRLAQHKHPFRRKRGTFRCPADAGPIVYEKTRNQAIKKFIRAMDQQGWELVSRIEVHNSPFPVVIEPDDQESPPEIKEYIVVATFRKRDFDFVRIPIVEGAPAL